MSRTGSHTAVLPPVENLGHGTAGHARDRRAGGGTTSGTVSCPPTHSAANSTCRSRATGHHVIARSRSRPCAPYPNGYADAVRRREAVRRTTVIVSTTVSPETRASSPRPSP
ncbi:hypothetical protein GCM10018953_50820 [Streptosporangium nondiastaticum]